MMAMPPRPPFGHPRPRLSTSSQFRALRRSALLALSPAVDLFSHSEESSIIPPEIPCLHSQLAISVAEIYDDEDVGGRE